MGKISVLHQKRSMASCCFGQVRVPLKLLQAGFDPFLVDEREKLLLCRRRTWCGRPAETRRSQQDQDCAAEPVKTESREPSRDCATDIDLQNRCSWAYCESLLWLGICDEARFLGVARYPVTLSFSTELTTTSRRARSRPV